MPVSGQVKVWSPPDAEVVPCVAVEPATLHAGDRIIAVAPAGGVRYLLPQILTVGTATEDATGTALTTTDGASQSHPLRVPAGGAVYRLR